MKESRRGDRKKRERQDHGACRATWEGREEQKISFVQNNEADVGCHNVIRWTIKPNRNGYQRLNGGLWGDFIVEFIWRL